MVDVIAAGSPRGGATAGPRGRRRAARARRQGSGAARGTRGALPLSPADHELAPWYAACDADADDERVRGRPVRRLRGDGDGNSDRRAGAAGQRRADGRHGGDPGDAPRRCGRLRRRAGGPRPGRARAGALGARRARAGGRGLRPCARWPTCTRASTRPCSTRRGRRSAPNGATRGHHRARARSNAAAPLRFTDRPATPSRW